jgi:hypothetical protein
MVLIRVQVSDLAALFEASKQGLLNGRLNASASIPIDRPSRRTARSLPIATTNRGKTPPTTMLGAIAVLQYLAANTLDDQNGVDCMPETIDGEAWPVIFFRTLASALVEVQP